MVCVVMDELEAESARRWRWWWEEEEGPTEGTPPRSKNPWIPSRSLSVWRLMSSKFGVGGLCMRIGELGSVSGWVGVLKPAARSSASEFELESSSSDPG